MEQEPFFHGRGWGGILQGRHSLAVVIFLKCPPCYSAWLGRFCKNIPRGVEGSSWHTAVHYLCRHLPSYGKKPRAGPDSRTRHRSSRCTAMGCGCRNTTDDFFQCVREHCSRLFRQASVFKRNVQKSEITGLAFRKPWQCGVCLALLSLLPQEYPPE